MSTVRNTFNINFYCRESKQNGYNEAPVEMGITINGKRCFINLPCKFNPIEFNRKRQPEHIRRYLSEFRVKISNILSDMLHDDIPLTTDNLRMIIRNGVVKSYTIRQCFEEYLSYLKKRVNIDLTQSAYRKYELTKELFFQHVEADSEITEVTPSVIQNFYADLRKTYKPASSASYIAKTKTFIQYAIDNGKLSVNPFQNLKVERPKPQLEYLTEEEIEKIKQKQFSTEALQRCADVFLVQIYSGLSYIDIENLRKEDIKEENGVYYIRKGRIKTGVEYTAVLFPDAIPILQKYDFKLPIISNQKTNSALKAIARECDIDKRIYSHLGRKTYGTMLLVLASNFRAFFFLNFNFSFPAVISRQSCGELRAWALLALPGITA